MGRTSAFTLIELLVVVTIIAVLLALLTPGLDRAVYQAELAVCATNLKSGAQGVYVYAVDYKRRYPYRANFDVNQGPNGVELLKVADNPLWDLRPMLRPYLPMKNLLDPFSGKINYDTLDNDSNIQCNYSLWFDYGMAGQQRMSRIGQRFAWTEGGETTKISLLMGDYDLAVPTGSPAAVFNGHPETDQAIMSFVLAENLTEFGLPGIVAGPQGRKWSCSRWQRWDGIWRRGPVDQNYGYEDGSVRRFTNVPVGERGVSEDDRMVHVPPRPYASDTVQYWSQVPRED